MSRLIAVTLFSRLRNAGNYRRLLNYKFKTNKIMKKVFLMAALVLSSAYALAQNPVGSWNIQPRVGMNIANLSGTDGTDARIGVAMGAELEYQVSDKLSLS